MENSMQTLYLEICHEIQGSKGMNPCAYRVGSTSGFRSRWTTPWKWQKDITLRICTTTAFASSSEYFPPLQQAHEYSWKDKLGRNRIYQMSIENPIEREEWYVYTWKAICLATHRPRTTCEASQVKSQIQIQIQI